MLKRYLSIVVRRGRVSPVSPGTILRSASSSSGEGYPLRAVSGLLCPLSEAAEYDDTFMPFLSVTVPAEGGRYQPDMKPGAAGGQPFLWQINTPHSAAVTVRVTILTFRHYSARAGVTNE